MGTVIDIKRRLQASEDPHDVTLELRDVMADAVQGLREIDGLDTAWLDAADLHVTGFVESLVNAQKPLREAQQ